MERLEQTLYGLLGIPMDVTLKEIKVAYRKKAIEYHPDNNSSIDSEVRHNMMCKINEAYTILRDAFLRKIYDESLLNKQDSPDESDSAQYTSTNKTKKYDDDISRYEYYNEEDFNRDSEKHFIVWLENFFFEYINFYGELETSDNLVLENVYKYFRYIINSEKELFNEEVNSYKLRR